MEQSVMHKWEIVNASPLFHYQSTAEHPLYIESSRFSFPSNDGQQFYLRLYPSGKDTDRSDYVSLYLCSTNLHTEQIYLYVLTVCGHKSHTQGKFGVNPLPYIWLTLYWSAEGEQPCSTEDHVGFKNFISRNFLLNQKNGFLHNNKLIIFCQVCLIFVFKIKGKLLYLYRWAWRTQALTVTTISRRKIDSV